MITTTSSLNRFILSAFFLTISVVLLVFENSSNSYFIYFLMNFSLLLYVISIIFLLFKQYKSSILLHPLALSLIFNFLFFSGGLTNYFLLQNDFSIYSDVVSYYHFNSRYYVKAGLLSNIAAICLVFGYYSKIGLKLEVFLFKKLKRISYYELRPNTILLFVFVFLSYYIKIILMNNGLFGRIIDPNFLASGSEPSFLASQLRPLNNLSIVPFVIISYHYFKHARLRWLFYLIVCLEFFFAFLEAARGPIMAVFIVLFIIKFYVKRKIETKWLVYGFVVMIFAFSIVNNFKNYVLENQITRGEPFALLTGFINNFFHINDGVIKEIPAEHFILSTAGRMNYMNEMSGAIAYKDETGLRDSDPPFLKEILLIPLNTLIPRSLQGIPAPSWGDWFRFRVLNRGEQDSAYNIAFSPLAFFYFTGGVIAIIFGFLAYGVLLRSIEYLPNMGFLGFLLFILIGSTIVLFKTAVPQVMVSYFRLIILVILIPKLFPKIFRIPKSA